MRTSFPLFLALSVSLLPGCISHRIITPQAALGQEITTGLKAGDFEVLGTTEGESSGGAILCIIPYGDIEAEPPAPDSSRGYEIDGRIMAAVHKALERMSEADALLRARVAYSTHNWLLWCSWNVKVAGDAIKLRTEK